MSSFLLYVDNKVLKKGSAYTNHSGYFYPVTNSFRDYDVVASPFKQFVYDTSVTGATVMSGIYYDTSTPTSTTFDGRAHNQYKFIKFRAGSRFFVTGRCVVVVFVAALLTFFVALACPAWVPGPGEGGRS